MADLFIYFNYKVILCATLTAQYFINNDLKFLSLFTTVFSLFFLSYHLMKSDTAAKNNNKKKQTKPHLIIYSI